MDPPERPRTDETPAAPAAETSSTEDDLLSLNQVSQRTGLPMPTLLRCIGTDLERIPHTGTGRARRYKPEAVAVFKALAADPGTASEYQRRMREEPEQQDANWPSVEAALSPHRRTCWKPVVKEGDGTVLDSKFSGLPLLEEGEEWPVCPHCGKPMPLILQLNPKDLPPEASEPFGEDILQLFCCTNKDGGCEQKRNNSRQVEEDGVRARLKSSKIEARDLTESPVDAHLPARRIVGWEPHSDYPIAEGGVDSNDAIYNAALERGFPRSGDKLFGWPHWLQGVEYPECPDCGEDMNFVFQIDFNLKDDLSHIFGDGVGHITQCRNHRSRVAFNWACT